jgi:isocitrate dehydrogenase
MAVIVKKSNENVTKEEIMKFLEGKVREIFFNSF